MIKFFRQIRQQLVTENKFSKYLLYAIGEIVLVVIGILIALQINNSNENRKNRIREMSYLENLKVDIKSDSIFYERTWLKNGSKKIAALIKAKDYYKTKVIPNDTLQFLNDISFGGIYGVGRFISNNRTFKELVSTGNISLISDEVIRKHIGDYYLGQDFSVQYAANLQSGYADYLNSIKVFNPKFPNTINRSEIPMMLKMMQRDEFYLLINKELTYAYSYINRVEGYKKDSHHLYTEIEAYLNQKR
ncbi:conserved hypothetical protein [Formosa agariphila KMM 3901]|uniref:Uncharacterized protein n=1 Tax=Formosa agariphila (strain DSM 15362 / KCTC 12365 / LMG 23005 / KMM 3901 / M-2Alg 35-1) TaxID=1347342 RepID=T2KND0_FORAG|nr:DUF6090 family protein [Formosa agariphila]CDF79499.1 conserved hypothetical protein [Formosa agariphila KMM 3901]